MSKSVIVHEFHGPAELNFTYPIIIIGFDDLYLIRHVSDVLKTVRPVVIILLEIKCALP